MYRRFFIIVSWLFVLFFCGCSDKKETDPLKEKISKEKLADDFRIFRKIIESGHPSINNYVSEKRAAYILDSLSKTITGSLTLREFYNKLVFFSNKIRCAHTIVALPNPIVDSLYNKPVFFPLPVILIGNKVIVNTDDELTHGTEILLINNEPVSNILQKIAFYNPVDGHARITQTDLACKDFGYQYYKYAGDYTSFSITLKDTLGEIKQENIKAITLDELREKEAQSYYYDPVDVPYSLYINDKRNYALLRLATFDFGSSNARSAFEDFLKNSFELLSKKQDCNNLIIDIRENGGGYLYECFLFFSYLTKSPFKEYKSVDTKIKKLPYSEFLSKNYSQEEIQSINDDIGNEFIRKGAFRYTYTDSLITQWDSDKNHFKGNIYVITNSRVMSAASYFATLVRNSESGKIVGVETRGGSHSGNGFETLEYTLPNTGLNVKFPYAKLLYSYGSLRGGSGLIPDYYVADDDSSFMKNNDKQLLYILDSLIKR